MCNYSVGSEYKLKVCDHILDSIYGQIGLTEVEKAIERLPLFKRLHNLSQLGLVKWIFPCALHTRYVHSIGVMHIAGEMARHININMRKDFFNDSEIQLLRLAGLLHDIGHYPLSHNVEHAYKDTQNVEKYRMDPISQHLDHFINCPAFLKPQEEDMATDAEEEKDRQLERSEKFCSGLSGSSGLHHEHMGYLLIINNKEIRQVVRDNFVLLKQDGESKPVLNPFFRQKRKNKYTDKDIDQIVKDLLTAIGNIVIGSYECELTRYYRWLKKYSIFVQLIHSDLDADNLDYLLRDATFSGTSYGLMDMGLLLNCLYVKEFTNGMEKDTGETCEMKRYLVGVTRKGVGAVEQFLLGKFMAYSQMIFSKYVSILEAMILRIESEVIISHDETHDVEKLVKMVEKGSTDPLYLSFTDSHIFNRLYDASRTSNGHRRLPEAIINRLIHSTAFDLAGKDDCGNECICVGINKSKIKEEFEKNSLYKNFVLYYSKIKDKTGQEIIDEGEEAKLFAYRFEQYALTSMLPFEQFENDIILPQNDQPSRRFNMHYFRLGKGIPILDIFKDYIYEEIENGKANRDKIPDLFVDSPLSIIKNLREMQFVALRKYDVVK